jgi:LacI family transcriptional regulator, galactose operon repressor
LVRRRQPGLKHLASDLGLSITTVSRALAGYSDVSAETRRRVMMAAEASNYVPNSAARMLVSGRSDFIGMLLPVRGDEIIDSYLSEFIVGLSNGLTRRGRDLFLAAVPRDEDDLVVLRHLVDSRRADAIVLYRTFVDDPRARFLLERRVPFISHGRTLTQDMNYAWIDTDGHTAFATATRLLLDLGHTEFAFFGPTQPYAYAHFRQRGVEDALHERGLPLDPTRILTAPTGDRNAMAEAADRLLDRSPRPTAVLGAKDKFALAILEAAARRGIAVPDQLSVIGFDDLPVAAYAAPALSTFAQRMTESAEIVADMIADRLELGPQAVAPRLIESEFIARASHGPAPDPRRTTPRRPTQNRKGGTT